MYVLMVWLDLCIQYTIELIDELLPLLQFTKEITKKKKERKKRIERKFKLCTHFLL